MAKVHREQQRYLEGMERALRIAREEGLEVLEKEVRYRSSNPLPCNVSPAELTAVAREGERRADVCSNSNGNHSDRTYQNATEHCAGLSSAL